MKNKENQVKEIFKDEELCYYLIDNLFTAVEYSMKNFGKLDPEYMIVTMTGIRILNRHKIKDEYAVHKFCWIFIYVLCNCLSKGLDEISGGDLLELIKLNWDKTKVPEL